MASKRYDMMTPRKGKEDKTFWTRIGTAWENDKGIQLVFDALPLPDAEGRCVANLFEPRDRDQQHRSNLGGGQPADKYADDDLGSDSVPF
jgi:hypothetical protein